MKKSFKYLIIFFFFLLSIYYTNKSLSILKINDPLMKEIKNNLDKYKIEPVNAIIHNNTIIPGKNGKEVDIEKSYDNMKKYGTYNEGLTKIKDTIPVISINNNLDKYIKYTSNDNKTVALIFIINKDLNINNLIKILNTNKIDSTFFLEENQIEKNIDNLKNTKYEIELLNPNKNIFLSTKSYIETLTNQKLKFCYTEKENNNLLELCENNKMHTIIPSIIIKKELYKNIKSNIETSPIISIYLNKYIEKELNSTIEYLKKKGYKFYNLKKLISEEN